MKKDKEKLKKEIQDYWTINVPRLNEAKNLLSDNPLFYERIDDSKYRSEPYVFRFIDSVAESGRKVLEIGVGLGTDLRYFAKKGMKVHGLDLSFSNALLVHKGFSATGLNGKVITGDAENLAFADETFDLFYSYGVLHHTPDTQKAIDEAHRVLKKNGKVLIMLYHKGLAYRWICLQYFWLKLCGKNISLPDMITKKYDHTPLSKMYSKEEARSMFSKFSNVEISVVTYGGVKENKKLWWIYYLLNAFPFLMNKLGSFLIIKAKK